MVRFLIRVTFWSVVLNRGRHFLLEGCTHFGLNVDGARPIWGPSLIRGNTVGKNFRETSDSYPLIRTRASAYQRVRIASFWGSFLYVLNEWTPCNFYIWRFDWLIDWTTMRDIFFKKGMPMTLAKFGTESMLVEMFKEPNLEEIWWFAKSIDYQISTFCEKVQVFVCIFNYF